MDEVDAPVRKCEKVDVAKPDQFRPDDPLLYRQLMAVKPPHMSVNKWLVTAEVNRSFFATLRKRGNAKWDIVQKLLAVAGLTEAEFAALPPPAAAIEARREERAAAALPFLRPDDEPRDIPLLGTALGADYSVGMNGQPEFAEVTDLHLDEVVDHLRRPVSLRGRAGIYALSVVGESMAPRFEPGDPAYVDPKATPRIGDDVVVYLRRCDGIGGERVFSVLIKRLIKRSAEFIELEQFNPGLTFRLDMKSVAEVHRVIPWREIAIF